MRIKIHPERFDAKVAHVWPALRGLGNDFIVIGETALAYALGGRDCDRIEVATSQPLDAKDLAQRIDHPDLGSPHWVRRSPDQYLRWDATGTTPPIHVFGKDPRPCLDEPWGADNGLKFLSPTDLLYFAASALARRGNRRDAADMITLLRQRPIAHPEFAASALVAPPPVGLDEKESESLLARLRRPDEPELPGADVLAGFAAQVARARKQGRVICLWDRIEAWEMEPLRHWRPQVPAKPDMTWEKVEPKVKKAVVEFHKSLGAMDLPPVSRLLLFGSHARGDFDGESDVDIAVVFSGQSHSQDARWRLRDGFSDAAFAIQQATGLDLNAFVMWEGDLTAPETTANPELYRNVVADGIEVPRTGA